MKTFTITLLLLVALLSVYTANGAPSSVEGALRKKFEAASMKIDETPIQSLRMLQEVSSFPVCLTFHCDIAIQHVD